MSEQSNIVDLVPFEHRAIGPDEVAVLIGCKPRTVLQVYACRPDFPRRIQRKPARWIAGEVMRWVQRDLRREAA